MAIESPQYKTVHKDRKFEIREYEEYVLAEVEIDADFGPALQKGFRVLADYIFGGNVSRDRIDMTAPVISSSIEEGKKYRIAFTMPSKYTLDNLPEPADRTISFRKVGKHRVAALRFSGNLNSKSAMRKANELEAWLIENKYSRKGGFVFAQYNPPWIPGVFRRNEVLAEV